MGKKIALTSLLILLLSVVSIAQNAIIKGIINTTANKPAEMVNVTLKGTSYGTVTDKGGNYVINDIPAGQYTLVASSVGLVKQEKIVLLKPGETLVINFTLDNDVQQLGGVELSPDKSSYVEDKPSQTLRINTPLLRTPQNIQVISNTVISDQQSFDMLEGIQRNVSGAQKVEHWDNYARINMRGSQLTAFRNGMNMQLSPWSPLAEDMSFVERIEFVKGPAGFMLASGEPSGFYNVVTKKPTGLQRGAVSFSTGSFETQRTTADLDGLLSKDGRLLYRLNLMWQSKGSHRDFEFNNRYTIAPVITYLIDDKSKITLEYVKQYSQMNVIGSNYAFSNRKMGELPINFTTAEPNLDPTEMYDRTITATFEHEFDEDWKFTAQVAQLYFNQVGQSLWPVRFSSENDSFMQRGISIWDAEGYNKNVQMYVNGKAQTGSITHNMLMGVDMSDKDYYADWGQAGLLGDTNFNIYDPVYGTVAASQIPQWDRTQDVRERGVRYSNGYSALYVQDEIGLFNDALLLTVAGRYTANKYINPYSGTTEDGKFTPRVGLNYSTGENSSVYAVYDEAFLANPGLDWQGNNFDPITGENMELGVKKDWANGKWNSVLSVYQITKNNVLTTDFEHPDPITGQFVYNRQTGQQQVQGGELDIRGELTKNLNVVVNYAYTDATITKDSDPAVVGNKVAGATEHLQNTWLTYRLSKGKLNGLRFSAGYQYQAGRSSWYIFDNTENSLPDYFRLDGGVGYTSKKFDANFLVNNILNEYLYSGAPSGGYYYWQTEPGRNVRLTVKYKF